MQFHFYCLPCFASQNGGLLTKLKGTIIKHGAEVVQSSCIQVVESAIFVDFLPASGCPTACERVITFGSVS